MANFKVKKKIIDKQIEISFSTDEETMDKVKKCCVYRSKRRASFSTPLGTFERYLVPRRILDMCDGYKKFIFTGNFINSKSITINNNNSSLTELTRLIDDVKSGVSYCIYLYDKLQKSKKGEKHD